MTTFDPGALLAMLVALYPTVSAAALARARGEHPDVFAGGELFGSKGDKLRLDDGRVFDLIFAAGGLPWQQRWQVLDVTNETGGSEGGLELTEGPLELLDDTALPPVVEQHEFETLVANTLGAAGDLEAPFAHASTAIAEAAAASGTDDGLDGELDGAEQALSDTLGSIDDVDPTDIMQATIGQDGEINSGTTDYVEPPPDDIPTTDPGDPPPDHGGGGEEPPQA